MRARHALVAVVVLGSGLGARVEAQDKAPLPSAPATGAGAVAATVNGQAIPEAALQRALKRIPAAKQAEARPEILNFLIDNALIDQYLLRAQVLVEEREVDAKVRQVAEEIKKQGSTFQKVLQELSLTEAELREQVASQLRWEKYVAQQATDRALRELFEANRDMFDGTVVRARHILLTVPANDPKAEADARARLAGFRKQVEDETARGLAKLPGQADNAEREKARARLVEESFAAIASKVSACPSRAQGGDIGWFPRGGSMVEPFARAAFALKPYEMSDVVTTQFGDHLILVTERKPGKDVKYDEVKDEVKEVFSERLREGLLEKIRPQAKILVSAEAPRP